MLVTLQESKPGKKNAAAANWERDMLAEHEKTQETKSKAKKKQVEESEEVPEPKSKTKKKKVEEP